MKNRIFTSHLNQDFNFEELQIKLYRLLLGNILRRGRKGWAEKVFVTLYNQMKQAYKALPEEVFAAVFERLRPDLGVRPKKVGGVVYKLPFLLSSYKQNSLSVKWLVSAARLRKGTTFSSKLLAEINDVYKGKVSGSLKKKNELHKLAFANRAFLR